MKKGKITLLVLIIVTLGFATVKLAQDGFDIRVENETDEKVSDLYITYDNIKSDIKMPSIEPGKAYKLHVNPKENSNDEFDEAALLLEYEDNKGNLHTEYIIGYFEKGYSGKAVVNITSVDEKGKLDVEIKEDILLY